MTRTLTSAIALGVGLGLPLAALAESHDALGMNGQEQERLEEAGFAGARILPGIEVARVTADGETFYVFSGLDAMGGMDHGMDRADAGAAGAGVGAGTGIAAGTGTDTAAGAGEADDATTLTPGQTTADAVEAAEEAPAGMAAADDAMIGATDTEAQDEVAGTFDEPDDAETVGAAGVTGEDADAEIDTAEIDADLEPGEVAEGVEHGLPLEQQLEEAGFDDYEILDDARVAEVSIGLEGGTVWVIMGIDDADGDS